MTTYYNEFDPHAAAWLRQLIADGLITDGVVDDRSIIDVHPDDLKGFTRHHFFAGIGGWDLALQLANWPANRPVCTASLPCQPFSVAGNQQGKNDDRHLLPHFIELINKCNFPTIFGEQVPAAIRHGWLDDLYNEMEREEYAVGSIVLTAAGAGAPHIRQRLYWIASREYNTNDGVADTTGSGLEGCARQSVQRGGNGFTGTSNDDGMGDSKCNGSLTDTFHRSINESESKSGMQQYQRPSTDIWRNPEWLECRDGKLRPIHKHINPLVRSIKPGTTKMDDGISDGVGCLSGNGAQIDANNTQEARVMRLKGYGNAICVPLAAQFIEASSMIIY